VKVEVKGRHRIGITIQLNRKGSRVSSEICFDCKHSWPQQTRLGFWDFEHSRTRTASPL